MSFLNPLNWFKKDEESSGAAPISTGATAPAIPGPYTSPAGGRRRRHRRKGGQTEKVAGRRHRRKHSRRA